MEFDPLHYFFYSLKLHETFSAELLILSRGREIFSIYITEIDRWTHAANCFTACMGTSTYRTATDSY